jgi:hypothetical protein
MSEPFDYDEELYQLDAAILDFHPCRNPPIDIASLGFNLSDQFLYSIRERIVARAISGLLAVISPRRTKQDLRRFDRSLQVRAAILTILIPAFMLISLS